MSNNYDKGRLNLPFVGICTFGKYPYIEDWNNIKADVAILGAPFDSGSQYRSGARMGPRGIREASTLFSFGHAGAYDHENDVTYLPSSTTKIIDDFSLDLEDNESNEDPIDNFTVGYSTTLDCSN